METRSEPLILTSGASGRVTALFSLRYLRSLLILVNGFLLLLLAPFRRRSMEEKSVAIGVEREKSSTGMVVRVPSAMVARRAKENEAAARRAMAIQRLREGEGEGDGGDEKRRSWREFWLFTTGRGETLFTQSWTSTAIRTK